VSTASRVLAPTEKRCTTCEEEFLGTIFALNKSRVYIFGHKLKLITENKALSFLNKCAVTSNRLARWILEIQQYDIEINHIKDTSNYLADILSRNPAVVSQAEIQKLTQPQ
jgi:hypothetical protein